MNGFNHLISAPHNVRIPAIGMRSTTTEMQHSGWEFAADQDVMSRTLIVVARHLRSGIKAMTRLMEVDYYSSYRGLELIFENVVGGNMMLHVQMMGTPHFEPVDMVPTLRGEVHSLDDMKIFAPVAQPEQEIIVEDRNVTELLDLIIAQQEPDRLAYHKRKVQEAREQGTNPNVQMKAQILSIAS